MMRSLLLTLTAAFYSSLILLAYAQDTSNDKVQLGISMDSVPVASDFSGQDIVLFGSIETENRLALVKGKYNVVVEVFGQPIEAIVRKKNRVGGIWVNTAARSYTEVPSYYSVLSDKPLNEIADLSVLSVMGLGIDYLKAKPVDKGDIREFLTQGEFSTALRRIRIDDGLFYEHNQAVEMLSPSLFRATLPLPPNMPIGITSVRALLFFNGKLVDQVEQEFRVEKVGFEKWINDLAHNHSLIYGILAVLFAIFTGWFADFIFRKR